MKKLVFMFVAFAAISLASCDKKKAANDANQADTTAAVVTTDSTAADSTAATDSTATVAADSAAQAAPADSAAQAQ